MWRSPALNEINGCHRRRVAAAKISYAVVPVDRGRDSLEHICVVSENRPKPIVLFTQAQGSNTIEAAVRAGVSAYVVDGLESSRVHAILNPSGFNSPWLATKGI